MPVPEILILLFAAIECLAVLAMGLAAYQMYRRAKTVQAWVEPGLAESKAIASRGKATALESRDRALAFANLARTVAQHVGQKVQTTTRVAKEVVHPDRTSLQQAARAVAGPVDVARRLSRLHQAGKIAAGQGNGRGQRA
jgi:hypothetical protein